MQSNKVQGMALSGSSKNLNQNLFTSQQDLKPQGCWVLQEQLLSSRWKFDLWTKEKM